MQYNIPSIMFILLLGALRAWGQCEPICGGHQVPCTPCVGIGKMCGIVKSQVINVYFCVPCCDELECVPEAPGAAWGYCASLGVWCTLHSAGVVMRARNSCIFLVWIGGTVVFLFGGV
ncbi:hypothetical protein DFH09DRAFT_1107983 [Mycena vulgaris]|nr:hypothetical protein DFH09DRAFT_1107983 [Mycena vulgaris]